MAALKVPWTVCVLGLLVNSVPFAFSFQVESRANSTSTWVQLLDNFEYTATDPTVCFGARDNSYGSFYLSSSTSVSYVLLTYYSGNVYNSGHQSVTNWGNPSLFGVFMTDSNNNQVFPDYSNNGNTVTGTHSGGWYSLSGGSPQSDATLTWQTTTAKTLSAGEYRLWYGEDLFGHTESDNGGTMCATVQVNGASTPSPTPSPTYPPGWPTPHPTFPMAAGAGDVAATGDPHLQNIHGERFDLMKPGKHVLIHIPRGEPAETTLLSVEAEARQLGGQCADMYFQEVNITGAWVEAKQTGGLRFQAQGEGMSWAKFGQVRLKVAHGRTQQGIQYLNFYVKHLGRARFAIGGLLGEDDHMKASMPSAYCVRHVSLIKTEHSATSVAEANLGE